MNAIRKMCTKEKQKVDFATLSALQNAECELPASNLKNIEEIDAEDVNTEDISQINCNKNENFLAERSIRADADSHLLIEISNKSLSQNKLSEKSKLFLTSIHNLNPKTSLQPLFLNLPLLLTPVPSSKRYTSTLSLNPYSLLQDLTQTPVSKIFPISDPYP